jgi:hypothetical protein
LGESEKPGICFANAKSGSDSASDAIADSDEGADTNGHAISADACTHARPAYANGHVGAADADTLNFSE